jgi:hypothetical protein
MPDTYSKADVMAKSSSPKKSGVHIRDSLVDQVVADKASALSESRNSDSLVCRICLDSDVVNVDASHPDFNPMISPCGCTGTVGGIHLKCLREWLERNKTIKAVRGHVILKYKKIACELCKQKFPFSIAIGNDIIDIVHVDRPPDNFIILETLSSGNQKEEFTKSKLFFILNTENKEELQLGRNTSCDVRIAEDISVSREHSKIRKLSFDNPPRQEYWIIDNDSTFGTLV